MVKEIAKSHKYKSAKKILEYIKIQNLKQILNLQETSIVLFTMSNYKQLACGPKNDSSMMVSCVDKDPASRVWRVPATRPEFFFATRIWPELFFKIL